MAVFENFDSDKERLLMICVVGKGDEVRKSSKAHALRYQFIYELIPEILHEIFAGCLKQCLFHWRKDDTDCSKYSLKLAYYFTAPMYVYYPKDPVQHTSLLNKMFWNVFRDVVGWQSVGINS